MNWQKEVIKNYNNIDKYNVIGLRSLCRDENYQVRDYTRCSYDWDFENDCSSDVKLGGTCAIMIDNSWLEDAKELISRINSTIPTMKRYYGGDHIVLIGGHHAWSGSDEGEAVIVEAEVIAIIK
jgi:hypothetical protein